MARVRGFGLADGMLQWRCGAVGLCVMLWSCAGAAQNVQVPLPLPRDAAQEAGDATVPTLHVYTDLVQVPALVLRKDLRPLPAPEAEGKFFLSFDGGPKFRATHTRLEGDDPIALSILLDLRQPFPQLIDRFGGAAAGLAPVWLTAKDRVSIYSLGCNFVRSAADAAPDQAALAQGVQLALEEWKVRKEGRLRADCPNPWGLWDSMTAVVHAMQRERGRRVLLVVTDGVDRGSKTTWNDLRVLAQQSGVAIFGLIHPDDEFASLHSGFPSSTNTFGALCELSGGMVLTTTLQNLATQLKYFTALVRGRYIVEFPRPSSATGGAHDMEVTVADRPDAFIRSAGVTVPVDDPAILNDPTTVPMDRKNLPELGKGKPVVPK
jgi:hypothetical protein